MPHTTILLEGMVDVRYLADEEPIFPNTKILFVRGCDDNIVSQHLLKHRLGRVSFPNVEKIYLHTNIGDCLDQLLHNFDVIHLTRPHWGKLYHLHQELERDHPGKLRLIQTSEFEDAVERCM